MESLTQIMLSVLGVIGIGGIITNALTKQKELDFKRLEQREKRYKSLLLFMDVYLIPDRIKYLMKYHPDITTKNDVIAYIEAEFNEMILYASKDTVFSVKNFLEQPTQEHYYAAVIQMRKDLWDKKTRFFGRDLIVNLKEPQNGNPSSRP